MPSPGAEGVSAAPTTHRRPRLGPAAHLHTLASMRHESSVTSISWIPSEAIDALAQKIPFDMGLGHYDGPPPDAFDDLETLRDNDRFRFANHLAAFIDVKDGQIIDHGYTGGG